MLHPQVRELVAAVEGAVLAGDPGFELEAVRGLPATDEPQPTAAGVEVPVADVVVGGVLARLYRDDARAGSDAPLLLHLHGGGWVAGDLVSHDAICRELVVRTGWAVLALDYRLAPEHPFPAALEDVDAVLAALDSGDATRLQVDTSRLAVIGDSAGGNLAAAVAMRCRDTGRALRAQILVYPCLDARGALPSYTRETGGLTRGQMDWYWAAYCPDQRQRLEPQVSPLEAGPGDLTELAPALVISAEHDPLCDEAEMYAARLADAGVDALGVRYLGMVHGFWRRPATVDAARTAVDQVAGMLRSRDQ